MPRSTSRRQLLRVSGPEAELGPAAAEEIVPDTEVAVELNAQR